MLVELLVRHRHHTKLRPAILKAILGVEHNYSFREPVSYLLFVLNSLHFSCFFYYYYSTLSYSLFLFSIKFIFFFM